MTQGGATVQDPLSRPGKIVAIHLSYASRSKQRGRRPKHLSYFFKAPSTFLPRSLLC